MRIVYSVQHTWSALTLSLAFVLTGCGQTSTPQNQFVTDEEVTNSKAADAPTGPLSMNEFDSRVTTAAGELPSLSPGKTKPADSEAPLSEEAQEDLADAEDSDAAESPEEVAEPKEGTP